MTYRIPFNRPIELAGAAEAVLEALGSGHLAGNGPYSKRCEAWLEERLGRRVLLTSSATHALEMMALLLEPSPGDEIIVPSFTFVSTANAFVLHGFTPRFADVDERGLIVPEEVERLRTPRTRAVIAVHYAGNAPDLDALEHACARHGLALLEDAAQAIGSAHRDRPLGAVGALGCLSFHETKNVGCGEGGALILGDDRHRARAEILREKGTNRTAFAEGRVDKYTWVDVGSSYLVSDLNAAYLWAQLVRFAEIEERRGSIWARYRDALVPALRAIGARVITPPPACRPNHHLFAIVLGSREERESFIAHMREKGIWCPFHYVSLHDSPFGARFRRSTEGRLPNAEALSSRLVRLPLFFNLSPGDQETVIAETLEWVHGRQRA